MVNHSPADIPVSVMKSSGLAQCILLSIFISLFASSASYAEDVFWVGGSGSWADGSNWSTGSLPTAGDDVFIEDAGSELTITIAGFSPTVRSLQIDEALVIQSGTLSLLADSAVNGPLTVEAAGAILIDGETSELSIPSLVTISSGSFQVRNSAVLNIPALENFHQAYFDIEGLNAELNVPLLVDIDNSRIRVADGAVLSFPGVTSYSNDVGLSANIDVFQADGAGSLLDLSSFTSWDVQASEGGHRRVRALSAGTIDLSGLQNLEDFSPNGYVWFYTISSGVIDLSSLNTLPDSSALASLTGGDIELSSNLTVYNDVIVEWDGVTTDFDVLNMVSFTSGLLIMFGQPSQEYLFSALIDIDNSSVSISGGATARFPGVTSYSHDEGLSANIDVFQAVGSGSLLDLSSLTSWDVLASEGGFRRVWASSGGAIDLSSLQNLSDVSPDAFVWLYTISSGTIDLTSLDTIPDSTALLSFTGGDIDLSSKVTTYNDVIIEWDGVTTDFDVLNMASFTSGTITISGQSGAEHIFDSLTNFNNSKISLSGGAIARFPGVASYSNDEGLSANIDVFAAHGNGSLLDLSSLTNWDVQPLEGGFRRVSVSSGGVVDLSSLQSLSGFSSNAYLWLYTLSLGTINLSSLDTIPVGSALLSVAGGDIDLSPSLTTYDGVTIEWDGVTADLDILNMESFTSGSLSIQGQSSQEHLFSALTNLDNSVIFLTGGAVARFPEIESYSSANLSGNISVFRVHSNSLLDLSSLTSWDLHSPGDGGQRIIQLFSGGDLDLSSLSTISRPAGSTLGWFDVRAGSSLDLSSLVNLVPGPYLVEASGAGAFIDLQSLCAYADTTINQVNGGVVSHNGAPTADLPSHAFFGVRSVGQVGACSGDSCSQTELFSYLQEGRCFESYGTLLRGSTQVDVDALAVSPDFGVLGFELVHDEASGAVSSSRLVSVDPEQSLVTIIGPDLVGVEVRGGAFLGDDLWVVDSVGNALLKIEPSLGTVVGAPLALMLDGGAYDVSDRSDLAFNQEGTGILSDGNSWYSVDIFSGEMTLVYTDSVQVALSISPEYLGNAFGANSSATDYELHQLHLDGPDYIYSFDESLSRTRIVSAIAPLGFDGVLGDLGSVSTVDTMAPGAVTISIDPEGDGTDANLDWSTYDESLNGNDIHHYSVYTSTTDFVNTFQATEVGSVPAGIKTYHLQNLTRDEVVFVAVVAVDVIGNANSLVTTLSTVPVDTQAPGEVTGISTDPGDTSIDLVWQPPADTDLTSYRVYQDGELISGDIPANVLSYAVVGLQAATGYSIRISTVDEDGNESGGGAFQVATLLPNPLNVSPLVEHLGFSLSWDLVQPSALVSGYRIYVEESDFGSVSGLTPKQTVPGASSSGSVSGLQNGTTYYIAVTTLNISGGETQAVNTVTAIPNPDTLGPVLSDPAINGAALIPSFVVDAPGIIRVNAVDNTEMARVEFRLDDGSSVTPLGVVVGAGPDYEVTWDLTNTPDGSYTVVLEGFDSRENSTVLSVPITVDFAAPVPPVITDPANGFVTNEPILEVAGTASVDSAVRLYNNSALVAGPLAVDGSGAFSASLTLSSGTNILSATAEGRGGVSASSSLVTVTLDNSVPDAPTNLFSRGVQDGVIQLGWNAVSGNGTVSYDLYRSNVSLNAIESATKINSSPLTNTSYSDLPPSDGDWFYRVVAVSSSQNVSQPSNQSSGTSDRVPPAVTNILYTSTGAVDRETGRMAPGFVTVQLAVSESLLTAPFLSFAFSEGVPLSVNLVQISETEYQGSFEVTSATSNGSGTAVFSARDLVGNRGTVVEAGGSIWIDTKGPQLVAITTQPPSPIENISESPTSVTVTFQISEAPLFGTTPEFGYFLSTTHPTPVILSGVSPVGVDFTLWEGTFTLPSTAGENDPESLIFTYRAEDDLGNIETQIQAENVFQVYQGALPPLDIPSGLSAEALSGGRVSLQWDAVQDAFAYQLYRQAPGEPTLELFGGVLFTETFEDQTSLDGEYLYAVASIREVNSEQSLSAASASVSVTADSIAPNPPENLQLSISGQGVQGVWKEPNGSAGETLKYALYRNNVSPGTPIDVTGLVPVIHTINGLAATDTSPSESEHAYAVTAVDEAGNESVASNTEYLNFSLLPVSTLSVLLDVDGYPTIDWSYNGSAAETYRLEVDEGGNSLILSQGVELSYTDVGYSGGSRVYTVVAIDSLAAESVGRTILLPDLGLVAPAQLEIRRGIFNVWNFTIENRHSEQLEELRIAVNINGVRHQSELFGLSAGGSSVVPVVIGGYASLLDTELAQVSIEIAPNEGEFVEIRSNRTTSVASAALAFSLDTQNFTQGATGQVRFSLENSSDVVTEIVTARSTGSAPSDEVRFVLRDNDGNIYSETPLQQVLGESVITLSDGTTVVRIEPGSVFTSDWLTIDVPQSVPAMATVELEVDAYHFQLGTAEHVQIQGVGTARAVELQEPPYQGELLSVLPQASFEEAVTITGRALSTDSAGIEAFVPLELILQVSGFEYSIGVSTNSDGEFVHILDPSEYAPGLYTISIIYPGTLDRPDHGTFTLNRLSLSPSLLQLSAPRNYVTPFDLEVMAGPGTSATQVALQFLPEDQNGQVLPQGIVFQLPAPQDIGSAETVTFSLGFAAESSAASSGQLFLRLVSAETGSDPIAFVTLNYNLSEAAPSLSFTPPVFETGVTHDNIVSGSVSFQNNGLAPLLNAQIELLQPDGIPAPGWIYSSSALALSRLEIGDSAQVDLFFAPDSSITVGFHQFIMRVSASGGMVQELPIVVAVNQDGIGSVLVHVADIYTATLDENNQPILGLEGAFIQLQHASIPSIQFTGTSDAFGELLFTDVPAGSYFLRGSASGHNDDVESITIFPGLTTTEELFLVNQVVSVEWSVTEIILDDYYEIILEAVFETDVPVAVVVLEPAGIQLPAMSAGEVFLGELTATNYGLIDATGVRVQLPQNDYRAQYEFLSSVPPILQPNQRVVIPYRVTALTDFTTSEGDANLLTQVSEEVAPAFAEPAGNSSCGYSNNYCVISESECANGTIVPSSTCSHWFYTRDCPSSQSDAAAEIIGGGPGPGGGSYVPLGNPSLDLPCLPGILCNIFAASPDM